MSGKVIQGAEVSKGFKEEVDVVIVGSGASGGCSSAEMAEAGLNVLVLEEGGYYTSDDFKVSGIGLDRYEIGHQIWRVGDIGTLRSIALYDCELSGENNCLALGDQNYGRIYVYYRNGTQKF